MPVSTAYKFARKHEKWVHATLANLPDNIAFTNGTILPIFGDQVRLDITIDKSLKRTTLKQYDDYLCIKTYQPNPSGRIIRHLKNLARNGLTDIAAEKADMINKKIKSVSIRDTKSRWASCSQDAGLSFSWRLIFAPYNAADYVVAHEVAHLIHMNHSRNFWELCKELSINYEGGKSWMKENGNSLMRYGNKK